MLEALLTLGTLALATVLTAMSYRFSDTFRAWADREMEEEN